MELYFGKRKRNKSELEIQLFKKISIPMVYFDSNSLQLYHQPIVTQAETQAGALVRDSKRQILKVYMTLMMWVPCGNTKLTVDNLC